MSGPVVKVGDWVRVLDADQILATLDDAGCLDGLAMMPEMLPLCGQTFRIRAQANKTCVDGQYIGQLENCYVLQTDRRCDGSAHGGCQMGCKFFWRRQWFESCDGPGSGELGEVPKQLADLLVANAKGNDGCFRCQSTQLVSISKPSSPLSPGQYIKDVRSGIPLTQVASFLWGLAVKKLLRRSDNLAGPCKRRTPVEKLGLQVGERVRVKSLAEIQKTLNGEGSNRGLWFDPAEMSLFCERKMVVSRVVNRLIDEATGELKELKQPSIVLSDTECSGIYRRFCSRGMLHFWREIWLERIE